MFCFVTFQNSFWRDLEKTTSGAAPKTKPISQRSSFNIDRREKKRTHEENSAQGAVIKSSHQHQNDET